MTSEQRAAEQFISAIAVVWDSRDQWEATAELGLAELDAEALSVICNELDADYDAVEELVLERVREKVAE